MSTEAIQDGIMLSMPGGDDITTAIKHGVVMGMPTPDAILHTIGWALSMPAASDVLDMIGNCVLTSMESVDAAIESGVKDAMPAKADILTAIRDGIAQAMREHLGRDGIT